MTVKQEETEPQIVHVDTVLPVEQQEQPQAVSVQQAVPIQHVIPQEFKAPETVDVIAPTNMAEGFQFTVDAAGQRLRVAVPPGGALAGQRFAAIVLQGQQGHNPADPHAIPRGYWRDDLCDCCRHGCCHPQFCLTFWCTPCALGQVMTRMRLGWCGQVLSGAMPPFSTYRIIFLLTTLYIIVTNITNAIITENDKDGDEHKTSPGEDEYVVYVAYVQDTVGFVFGIYVFAMIWRTRLFIRNKYQIPSKCCGDCEDCCCSFWCSPCTVCQMARHTANYDECNADCCSDTGLSAGVPSIV